MRPLTEFIIKENPYIKDLSIPELWERTTKRDKYRDEYAELWNSTATGKDEFGSPIGAVDVILCPVGPGAAPPLNSAKYWGYTAQWNLLDYPGLVFPVRSSSSFSSLLRKWMCVLRADRRVGNTSRSIHRPQRRNIPTPQRKRQVQSRPL